MPVSLEEKAMTGTVSMLSFMTYVSGSPSGRRPALLGETLETQVSDLATDSHDLGELGDSVKNIKVNSVSQGSQHMHIYG